MYCHHYMRWTRTYKTALIPSIATDFKYIRQSTYYTHYVPGMFCNMASAMGTSDGFNYNPAYAAANPQTSQNNAQSSQSYPGLDSDVFMCTWNPCVDLLASGSNNSTARIWDLTGSYSYDDELNPAMLIHYSEINGAGRPSDRDITAMDWSSDGHYLATGTFEGFGHLWSNTGILYSTMVRHAGPIFAMKWNDRGNYLLSVGADRKAIVWDTANCMPSQTFQFHKGPVIDADWKTNTCFATCSVDKRVTVCELDCPHPIRTFLGHEDEVNAVKWNPQGNLLASCSDDATLKIWAMEQVTPVRDLIAHTKEIYTIKWSPTGPCTNFPNAPTILASGSYDSTIRLWDIEKGVTLHTLNKHTQPIYCIDFSPDGQYLVSGSLDNWIYLWSTRTGELIHSLKAPNSIFDVSWNYTGTKICATSTKSNIILIDLKWY